MTTIIEAQPEPPAAPPRKRPLIARIVRFPLKLVLMALVGLILGIRHHPRVSGLIVALLVVAGGAVYYFTPPTLSHASAPTATQSALSSVQGSLPSPQAPVLYFRAQQNGDASAMWSLLADSVKQGGSVQQLQTKLDQMRPSMGVIKTISYVGGAKEIDGNSVYLYLITVDQGGQTAQTTYLFTLDQQGKILRVE